VTVTGAVRDAARDEPLRVKLTLLDGEIALRTNEVELGSWPMSEVDISPLEAGVYAFVAEGDRLLFTPDKAAAFADSPFLAPSETPEESPGRRRRSKRSWGGDTGTTDGEPARRPNRRERRADTATSAAATTKPARSATEVATPTSGGDPAPAQDGVWLRALDRARQRGLFGLDRVQIDESLRGREHQHTFDHGTAAGYGPSKHICTICGKIRL
jgi:hypothetical protein